MTEADMSYPRFHLAFPVTDLEAARHFYSSTLGCQIGRESERWIDFDFFGHQIVAHLVPASEHPVSSRNPVDGEQVPAMHFGPILEWKDFHSLQQRLESAGTHFVIRPQVRFAGRAGEQVTMFISDPSGNHLEFKSFRNPEMLFEKDLDAYR
jgi:extradiol dioxygenase family protein